MFRTANAANALLRDTQTFKYIDIEPTDLPVASTGTEA